MRRKPASRHSTPRRTEAIAPWPRGSYSRYWPNGSASISPAFSAPALPAPACSAPAPRGERRLRRLPSVDALTPSLDPAESDASPDRADHRRPDSESSECPGTQLVASRSAALGDPSHHGDAEGPVEARSRVCCTPHAARPAPGTAHLRVQWERAESPIRDGTDHRPRSRRWWGHRTPRAPLLRAPLHAGGNRPKPRRTPPPPGPPRCRPPAPPGVAAATPSAGQGPPAMKAGGTTPAAASSTTG